MSQAPKRITLDEALARRIMLVQSIEASDTQGKLLSPVEREDIDRLAAQAAGQADPVSAAQAQDFLHGRAQQVLRVVENRNPALAALQERRPWTHWLGAGAFVAAVLFGAATDRIANPHRVDLLALPLLAIIAWNLAVYAALAASFFLPLRLRAQHPPEARQPPAGRAAPGAFVRWASGLRGWSARAGQLRASITALFVRQWYGASAALQAQRWRKVLHLAAAGWAFGIGLSLFTRGLVVEYRVGWESTFLDAAQVHAILCVLLTPALALFPFQPFTVQDIASLQFSQAGQGTGALAGARWVYLYATLLALLVIAPRLLLAWHAAWRERVLSRRIALNLATPYYQRLLALLNPARIQLGLLALRPQDRDALLRIMRPRGPVHELAEGAHGQARSLIRTSSGETLGLAAVALQPAPPASPQPAPQARSPASGWAGRALQQLRQARGAGADQAASPAPAPAALDDDSDLLLLMAQDERDLDAALALLRGSAKPLLVLVNPAAALAPCRSRARAVGLQAEMLALDSFADCWVQDRIVLDALGRSLPSAKKESFGRLAEAWRQRNEALFAQSMQLIAALLQQAAREAQEAGSERSYVRRLTSSAERQAHAQALKDPACACCCAGWPRAWWARASRSSTCPSTR